MSAQARVRFAPSPTGYFHVGSARTALFNWLFARQQHGTYLLRIEDTDEERNREEWVDGIVAALDWLGMAPDEEPVRQSTRGPRYREAIDALFGEGVVYACDCTREAIDARTKANATPGYDRHCRDRGLPREGNALRFKIPDGGTTVVNDVIRGEVTFAHSSMDDFVCVKSTGQPLFVLANVVDDRDMAISHAIRGEDLLPTTPRGVLVWEALDRCPGYTPAPVPLPVFAHLPMLVNEQRKKLSKRRDPVAVELYRDQGYLPEAFRNYLALLGWSPPGDAEKVPVETLIEEFRLEDVHHAPAFFDVQKLTHMNGEYVRELPLPEFIERCRPFVAPVAGEWAPSDASPPWPPERFDTELFERLAPLVQERVAILSQVPRMVDFVFLEDPPIDPGDFASVVANDEWASPFLAAVIEAFESIPWNASDLKERIDELGQSMGRKLGKAQAPVRVSVTGRRVGPPLFEALEILGRDEVLRRIRSALDRVATAA